MEPWLETKAFEILALATDVRSFIPPDQADEIGRLQEQARKAMAELGLDMGSSEDLARFDAAMDCRLRQLQALDYREYLNSSHWQIVRLGALARADWGCQLCSSPRALQVHHRSYDNLGFERPQDLTVLCAGCHQSFHEHRTLEQ